MKRTKLTTALLMLLALGMGITGTVAYYSSKETVTNKFTVGEVKIDVTEPKWDEADDDNGNGIPDVAEDFLPTRTVDKDPTITNTGNNDAYVYFEVVVPTADGIVLSDENGNRLPAADDVELWTFEVKEGWTLLSKTQNDNNTVTYVYHANEVLAKDESITLFDTVTMANVIEGQGLEDTTQEIVVTGLAVQTENTGTVVEAYNTFFKNRNN